MSRLPPREMLEQRIAEVWEQLLGARGVGSDANFFELGGDSLLAAEMVERIADDTGRAVSLRVFFAGPTVRELAVAVSEAP